MEQHFTNQPMNGYLYYIEEITESTKLTLAVKCLKQGVSEIFIENHEFVRMATDAIPVFRKTVETPVE